MKKKYNLLNTVALSILFVLFLTWCIPAISLSSTGSLSVDSLAPAGILDLVNNAAISVQYFYYAGIWLASVAIFYAILNRIDAYGKLTSKITENFKENKSKFLIITVLVFALLSALVTDSISLALLVPFFGTILIALGYNKITTFASTVGAALVGTVAKVYNSYAASTLAVKYNASLLPRIVVFTLLVIALILLLLNSKESAGKKTAKKSTKAEVKKTTKKEVEQEIKMWPLSLTLFVLVLIFILGMIPWETIFNIDIFTNINTKLLSLSIGDFAIFGNLFGQFNPFGSFTTIELMAVLGIVSVVLVIVYKITLNNLTKTIGDGLKKIFPIVLTITLMYMVLVLAVNSGLYESLTNLILAISEKFNFAVASLASIVQTTILMDGAYIYNYGATAVLGLYTDASPALIDAIYQLMGTLTSLIAPTSVVLVAGLYYFEVPYTGWVKFIWKYLVCALIVAVIIITLMVLEVGNIIYWSILILSIIAIIAYVIYKNSK